jgi:type II secretory pathway component PulM
MSTGAQYVVVAYGVVLFGLVMYLVAVGARSARLQREAELLARLVARETGAPDARPARPQQGAAARPDPRPVEAP